MFRIRTRYKVSACVALAIAGFLTATVAGPMYASYYWPKELAPNSEMAGGANDFAEMILSIENAKPIAATVNMLTAVGKIITATAIVGLAFTLFGHFRNRKRILHKLAEDEPQITQNAG